MKKIINRGFWSGALAGMMAALLIATAIPVMASSGSRTIDITYNNIKIALDGQQITPRDGQGNIVEPFIYEGTTYLPLRAIANALGLSVEWDGATQTVKLGTGVASGDWSRDNPAPIGTRINVDMSSRTVSDNWKGSMFIGQVLRGEEAEREFNQSLVGTNRVGENQEIILFKIYIDTASDSGREWSAGSTQFFTGFSGYNDRLALASYGVPRDGEGYVWRAYIVDKSDTQPKLAFQTTVVTNAWFKLY